MIKRATANGYVAAIIEQAKVINQGEYAWRIERIELFGSYLTEKSVLGDIDLMVTIAPRYADPEQQQEAAEVRRCIADNDGRSFSPYWLRAYWPQEEVHRKLKNGRHHISIHDRCEREQLALHGASFETIFEA